ncbi:MAG TPA: hypothetical protein VEY07_08730 [Thermoplasmata archaeon]|nr:hypothetical protein [Thermoplasmata archaeon]
MRSTPGSRPERDRSRPAVWALATILVLIGLGLAYSIYAATIDFGIPRTGSAPEPPFLTTPAVEANGSSGTWFNASVYRAVDPMSWSNFTAYVVGVGGHRPVPAPDWVLSIFNGNDTLVASYNLSLRYWVQGGGTPVQSGQLISFHVAHWQSVSGYTLILAGSPQGMAEYRLG